jgi:hypothetical protein
LTEGATPEYVREWARHAQSSPLYVELCGIIADDQDLLELMGRIEHTPKPNMFLGGVHFLLMGDSSSELAAFYPSLTADPRPSDVIAAVFHDFCLEHRDELIEIGATRYTQTNECRRCVALLPMIWESGFERFHLVDLGTSAGLNLALDRYSYRWGEVAWGQGSVELETEVRGSPPVPRPIRVLSRIGLDLNPIDPKDEQDRRWLDALIWPEHHDRRRRLRLAFETLDELEIELVAGDAVETLPAVLDSLPAGEPVVVMNSFVLLQLESDDVAGIEEIAVAARGTRPVLRVSMEVTDIEGGTSAELLIDDGTGPRTVGSAQPHGEWLNLYQARPKTGMVAPLITED